jgi:hypothetical protein
MFGTQGLRVRTVLGDNRAGATDRVNVLPRYRRVRLATQERLAATARF